MKNDNSFQNEAEAKKNFIALTQEREALLKGYQTSLEVAIEILSENKQLRLENERLQIELSNLKK